MCSDGRQETRGKLRTHIATETGEGSELNPEILLGQIETDIQQDWKQIAFSPVLEDLFRRATEGPRIRRYTLILILSLGLHDLFLVPEHLMMPDCFTAAKVLHLGIVDPIVLVMLALMRVRKISPSTAATVFISLVLVISLALMTLSHAPDAVLIAFAVPMLLIYGSVLPLPFYNTLILSIGAFVLSVIALEVHSSFDFPSRLFCFGVILCMTIFTPLATHRLEKSERMFYLLTLRETLRTTILSARNSALRVISDTDGLTGIGNRRSFDTLLSRLWLKNEGLGTPLSLLLIDIDHFKRLNDTHGHLVGDICLRGVAQLLVGGLRSGDEVVTRYGGEEFAVLLDGADSQRAAHVAERMRLAVERTLISIEEQDVPPLSITASIGCATVVPRLSDLPTSLIAKADQALYKAKRMGRNQTCTYSDGDTASALSRQ